MTFVIGGGVTSLTSTQRAKNPDRAVEESSQKGEKMRIFATTIRLVVITSLVFAATQATAVDCTPGPQCVDTIVVTPGDDGAGGDFIGGSGIRGGGGGGGGGISTQAIILTMRTACQKSGETCTQWGQRMVSKLTPTSPAPLCTTMFAAEGYSAISVCRAEVTLETSVNACANIPSCP